MPIRSLHTKAFHALVANDGSLAHQLRGAFNELVQGPTKAERATGLGSVFSSETTGVVRSVALRDGTAIVDLTPFFDRVPQVTTSEGGAHLMLSLNKTVFQFDEVEAVEYRVEGSCDAFWESKQGNCQVISRSDWERS